MCAGTQNKDHGMRGRMSIARDYIKSKHYISSFIKKKSNVSCMRPVQKVSTYALII